MAEKVSLIVQLAAIETALASYERVFEDVDFWREYPIALAQQTDGLRAAARTISFMREHEQTIRDAISSARTVDDTQDTR
jgi:hypothetical protein